MKKLAALLLATLLAFSAVGCRQESMNDIITNEPNMTGVVSTIAETSILIKNESGEYWVSLDTENKDSMTHFSIGDEVVVYFDGNIAETYPMQIRTVYAITLKTPTQRAENERS